MRGAETFEKGGGRDPTDNGLEGDECPESSPVGGIVSFGLWGLGGLRGRWEGRGFRIGIEVFEIENHKWRDDYGACEFVVEERYGHCKPHDEKCEKIYVFQEGGKSTWVESVVCLREPLKTTMAIG